MERSISYFLCGEKGYNEKGEKRNEKDARRNDVRGALDSVPDLLEEYNPLYPVWYEEEARKILAAVGDVFRISHIGSTAVEGLLSKPTVDDFIGVDAPCLDAGKSGALL